MISQVAIRVFGRVQGVGYRYFVRKNAIRLNLSGYAKNCDDGTVLIVAEGDEADLLTLAELCKIGPPRAVVDDLAVQWTAAVGIDGFSIS